MKLTIRKETITTYLFIILVLLLMLECFMIGGKIACEEVGGVYGDDLKCRIKEPKESNIIISEELKLNNYFEYVGNNNS